MKNNFKNSSHGFAFFIGGGEKLLGEIFVPKLSIRCIHKQIRNQLLKKKKKKEEIIPINLYATTPCLRNINLCNIFLSNYTRNFSFYSLFVENTIVPTSLPFFKLLSCARVTPPLYDPLIILKMLNRKPVLLPNYSAYSHSRHSPSAIVSRGES